MVDRQQQPLRAIGQIRQQHAQQRPLAQVQAGLRRLAQRRQRRGVGGIPAPQDLLGARRRPIDLAHAALGIDLEAQAQRVVLRQHRL
ncbi:hypothetical protein D3C86_1070450 [compost metagenome]